MQRYHLQIQRATVPTLNGQCRLVLFQIPVQPYDSLTLTMSNLSSSDSSPFQWKIYFTPTDTTPPARRPHLCHPRNVGSICAIDPQGITPTHT